MAWCVSCWVPSCLDEFDLIALFQSDDGLFVAALGAHFAATRAVRFNLRLFIKYVYIDHIKSLLNTSDSQREILQTDCVLMKSFYQTKGTILLTSDELIFVYMDVE